ncbi:MAG: hypothetical protein QT04_C0006G0009 [archaeon GW2011_AR11]|nr:MAG: hypothetical protein QT04_C0006G0009 [archaeon GW2011_AR11]
MQVNIKNFLFLFLLIFSFTTSADVHKWKDANGKTHYGDAPPLAGTEKVSTDKQTDDQIVYGEKNRGKEESFLEKEKQAAHDQKCEELLRELENNKLGDIGSKSFTQIATIKAKRNEITQEYKLRCK